VAGFLATRDVDGLLRRIIEEVMSQTGLFPPNASRSPAEIAGPAGSASRRFDWPPDWHR